MISSNSFERKGKLCQRLKYLYSRKYLIEMKGAEMTFEMEELLSVMVEYVRRHIAYQAVSTITTPPPAASFINHITKVILTRLKPTALG